MRPCPAPSSQWRMQASVLLFRWESYCWACNLLVLIIYLFFLPVMLPSVFPRLATDSAGRMFPGVWKPLFLKFPSRDGLPFPWQCSLPTSFVSFFVFCIFSYLFLKTMVCFSGCLMSSASLQKFFVEFARRWNVLLRNLWGRKWSSRPIPPPSLQFLYCKLLNSSCCCCGC